MNNDIILCLDISTSCIGFCILEDNQTYYGKVLDMGYVKLENNDSAKGIENLFLKKKQFIEKFIETHRDYKFTKAAIEEPLLGSNNINTVATLLRFNGIISDLIYTEYQIVPTYISSFDARKFAFPELVNIRIFNKNSSKREKKDILKSLSKNEITLFGLYPNDFPKKTILWNKVIEVYNYINWDLDKYGNLKKENFDANDALIVGLGTIHQNRYKNLSFKLKNVNVKDDLASFSICYWDKKKNIEIFI